MTTEIKITALKSGDIAVETPYHPALVKAFRDLMGRWGEYTSSSTGTVVKAWILKPRHRGRAEALIAELFPADETKIERLVRFVHPAGSSHAPSIDGMEIISPYGISRDRLGYVTHRDIVEIVENKLSPGGSKNHPEVRGSIILRIRTRPGAPVAWDGGTVEELPAE